MQQLQQKASQKSPRMPTIEPPEPARNRRERRQHLHAADGKGWTMPILNWNAAGDVFLCLLLLQAGIAIQAFSLNKSMENHTRVSGQQRQMLGSRREFSPFINQLDDLLY